MNIFQCHCIFTLTVEIPLVVTKFKFTPPSKNCDRRSCFVSARTINLLWNCIWGTHFCRCAFGPIQSTNRGHVLECAWPRTTSIQSPRENDLATVQVTRDAHNKMSVVTHNTQATQNSKGLGASFFSIPRGERQIESPFEKNSALFFFGGG